jgi:hypothetical protein
MVTNPNTKLDNAKYVRAKVMKPFLFKFILFNDIIAKNLMDLYCFFLFYPSFLLIFSHNLLQIF